MSRDYRIVKIEKGNERFWSNSPSFNVNVWCVEYYGRIFKQLGLPVHRSAYASDFPGFQHEYKGTDLAAVRMAMADPHFRKKLVEAVGVANEAVDYHQAPAEDIADEMLKDVFPLFQHPEAVSVASDYCEKYYENQ